MTETTSNNKPLIVVDSLQPVTGLIDKVHAYFGHMPTVWARYFTTTPPGEYAHKSENNPLYNNNIKLLPIARHTNHVGEISSKLGATDAKQGVNDLFETFGKEYLKSQGGEFLFFLDVEKSTPLSQEYYEGWSKTLVSYSQEQSGGSVTILPCVYLNYHDDITIGVLTQEGISCHGLWIARYYITFPGKTPDWSEHFAVPKAIQQHPSIPVFLRQFGDGGQASIKQGFDLDQTNPFIPNIQEDFLDKLISPPYYSEDVSEESSVA